MVRQPGCLHDRMEEFMLKKITKILSVFLSIGIAVTVSVQASPVWETKVSAAAVRTDPFKTLKSPDGAFLNSGVAGQAIFGYGPLFGTAVKISGSTMGNPFGMGIPAGGNISRAVTTTRLASPSGPISYVVPQGVTVVGLAGDLLRSNSTGMSSTPEPATLLLFGVGLIGLAGVSRKKTYQ